MRKDKFVLVDLERTIGTGRVHFWKGNKRGYTTAHGEAGRFTEAEAERLVTADYDNRTVQVDEKDFKKILHQYGEF
jgi:hypothetical protein